jgi:hypothetical protein
MIDLPSLPRPQSAEIGLQDFGGFLTPPLGGAVQRINRLGTRFKLTVVLPPIKTIATAMIWSARLTRGKTEGVRWPLPLQGFLPGSPGAVKVSGSGQSGTTLNIKGATVGYVFKEGQPFSVVTGGKNHVYLVNAQVTVGAGGTAAVTLSTPLRRQHLDNDVINVAVPLIEGFIMGDELNWSLAIAGFTGFQFDITESQ